MVFNRYTPKYLPEYELIDTGDFEKLESFGQFVIRRPEPQAVWRKTLKERDWDALAHASFDRKSERDSETGHWRLKPKMPDRWMVKYKSPSLHFNMRLALTSFKHVGIFPEQAENWEFISSAIASMKVSRPKVLNLFAYTGGASLAACQAGADVTHVDSVKQVIQWSRENMESSNLRDVRWVVEDAFKFVQREAKRGNQYHGIILDPPAYGRGPSGEKWHLEAQISALLESCNQILVKDKCFVLLNLYSMGFSSLISENLMKQNFGNRAYQSGELYLEDKAKNKLPLGTFVRFLSH